MNKLKVAVIGSGSFGTALGSLSARCGHNVLMYGKNKDTIRDVNEKRKNLRYFPDDVILPANLKCTDNIEECLSNASMVIHAIPVQKSYDFMMEHKNKIPDGIPYIISSKGILLKQRKFFSDAFNDIFPVERGIKHCVLSGPSFAIEIIKESPTIVTLACKDRSTLKFVQNNMHTANFKSYTTDDVKGVEIGGALKNPLAIAAGLVEGLGYGINTNSALITRGLKEMSMFSERFGGKYETLFGLSGVGDVMLTCLGALSRNKKVGLRLSKGETIDDLVNRETEVAEGVPTLYVLDEIIKEHNLNMPVFRVLAMIVKGQITPQEGGKYLMIRELEDEHNKNI